MLRRSRLRTRQPVSESADARLRSLIDAHADAVFRVASSIVRDRALAEDVVQETMIRAWQAWDRRNPESSERAWILRIAHNVAITQLRRQRDQATDPQLLPEEAEMRDPARHAEGRAEVDALREALSSLDPLSRAILVLRDVEGLSYQHISASLDVPISTVKTRLLRARREIHRQVELREAV